MATKGIWQLQKLTIRYCEHGGSSLNARAFVKGERFFNFVQENPQVEFHTELKNGRHPVVIGTYVSNDAKVCDIKNCDEDVILKHVQRMRNTSGRKMTRLKKPVVTNRPTFQGLWEEGIKSDAFTVKHVE